MKLIARLSAIALLSLPTMAIAQNLQHYQPGNRLIDGNQLNLMVDVVNGMAGGGTAGPGSFTTLTSTGNTSLANSKLTVSASTGATAITGATTITSSSALALAVGRQGGTNPALRVDANTSLSLTGLRITAAGTGAGLALAVVETGGTNNSLTLDAMGSGTVTINGTATGAISLARNTSVTGTHTITSASASSLAVGLAGATNPAFVVDSSTASQAAGLSVTGAIAAGTVAAAVISSGSDANLTINAKGTGTIGIGSVSTGTVTITPASTHTGVATFTNIPIFPATGITIGSTTFSEATLALYAKGVAAGYKVARGETALDGSNPTPVATGLTSIVACSLSMKITTSPTLSTSVVTYDTTSGTMNMYGWKPTANNDTTLTASDGTQTVGWVCVGT